MIAHLWTALYQTLWFFAPPLIRYYLRRRGQKNPAYLEHWNERFGKPYPNAWQNVIWIHAVSVGETRAAMPIIKELSKRLPESRLLITQMTPTGRATAQALFPHAQCRYLPYDKLKYIRQFLQEHRPQIAIFMETEIWVNLLKECQKNNIPNTLINARLSEKSLKGYLKIRPLIAPVLAKLNPILAQSEHDKQRLIQLGAHTIQICGNSKYDIMPEQNMHQLAQQFKQKIGTRPIIVCASTREKNGIDEAQLLLQAWRKIPTNALLIIIPRHPERFQAAAQIAQEIGYTVQKRSDEQPVSPHTQVWIGDSMGELFAYYLIADIAFVGGSLVDTGCQNIIEPIACGTPTLYGYSTYNFSDTCAQAQAHGAAQQIFSAEEWAEHSQTLLKHTEQRQTMSAKAADFIRQHQGSSQKSAEILHQLIQKKD